MKLSFKLDCGCKAEISGHKIDERMMPSSTKILTDSYIKIISPAPDQLCIEHFPTDTFLSTPLEVNNTRIED